MAGASVARAGPSSGGAASIDEMIMQRLEKAAPPLQTNLLLRRLGGLACGGLVRALHPGEPAPAQISIVEVGRVLRRLEDLWIVPIENLRVVGVAHQPNALIAAIGIARIHRARDWWDEVLVEVFLEIDNIACEDHRAGLR